ncbi:MAG: pyrrolo-quinoline quinone, partial [Zetaproteobacteria bacterium CG_4_8_14_3_um_filter_59_5]
MNMRFLRIPLVFTLLLSLGACSTISGTVSGVFGGNDAADEGGEPVKQAQQTAPVSELEIAWGLDVDQRRPLSPYSFARPAVAGDLIVLAGQDRFAHIYDMQGSEVRRVGLQAASDSGATAMRDDLVVLSDAQGILYGIDPQAGVILWQWQMPTVMLGQPTRAGDDMLVQTGDNSVYRISARGEKLWSFSSAQAGLSMNLSPSPLVNGDTSYAVLSNGDVVALKSDSGDLIWRRQLLLDNDAVVLSELRTPLA